MKVHVKKKAWRAWLKAEAKAGRMNDASGRMLVRSNMRADAMQRDYHPQGDAK